MKLGFASNDRARDGTWAYGGAGWARCGIPAEALRAHGHDVVEGVLVSSEASGILGVLPTRFIDAPVEERVTQALVPDVIVLQRWMNDGLAASIRRARVLGQVVVNDVDDLFDDLPVTNRAFHTTHPSFDPTNNVTHYRSVLAASSLVTVSTPYLADRLRSYCRCPIVVVRNALDLDRWMVHDHDEPPRLGWTGVLTHRANDIETIGTAIRTALGNGYDRELVHVGDTPGARTIDDVLGLDPEDVRAYPLTPVSEYPSMLRHLDVGVVPLSPHPFNLAKSCIKGMEYAAAGIPFVATDTPEYVWLHANYGIGLLASKSAHWEQHLRLLANSDQRTQLALDGRKAIAELSIESRWQAWEAALSAATA